MADGLRSTHVGLLDPRFEDLTEQREAVLDALAPPGSLGWLRSQARRIHYKPGWRFEILDTHEIAGALTNRFILAVTVVDPNRRLNVPEIKSPLPPGCEGQILSLNSSIMPYTNTAAEFAMQVRHVINSVEQHITDRWLRVEQD